MTGARGSAHYRFSDWLVCLFLLVFGLLLFFMSKELRYSKRMCWCHVERGREAKSIFKPALGYGWWDAAAVFMNILMENPWNRWVGSKVKQDVLKLKDPILLWILLLKQFAYILMQMYTVLQANMFCTALSVLMSSLSLGIFSFKISRPNTVIRCYRATGPDQHRSCVVVWMAASFRQNQPQHVGFFPNSLTAVFRMQDWKTLQLP